MTKLEKKTLCFFIVFTLLSTSLKAQLEEDFGEKRLNKSPTIALKTNLLYDLTTTMNLGIEIKWNNRWTVDIPINYNPWTFEDNSKWKQLTTMPELRYWLCKSFLGSYFGFHLQGGVFNFGKVHVGDYYPSEILKNERHEGYIYGAGITYGYQYIINNHFSLELSIGAGYLRSHYGVFDPQWLGEKLDTRLENYWGITNAGISVLYLIK